jgi:hypothetical protein
VLADAAAVALVLLLEPVSDLGSSSAPPAITPALADPTPATVGPAPVTPVASESIAAGPPDATPAVPLSRKLGAAMLLDSSSLATTAPGLGIESQLGVAGWAVAAYGVMLPARRVEALRGDYVDFALWAAGLRLCHAVWRGAVRVDACAEAELGRFIGRGSGLSRTQREVRDRWFAPGVGARVAWRALPHAALISHVDIIFPVLQETYVINRDDEVHDTPAATVRASVGLELDLL